MNNNNGKSELPEIGKEAVGSNSVVGLGNGLKGDFYTDGLLRIDGDFKGSVRGYGTLLIGEKGRVVGDIYAKYIRVGGKVKGNIYATEKVDVLNTGKLYGDLYSPKLFAEEGMIFTGFGKTVSQNEIKEMFSQNVDNLEPVIKEDF